MPTSNDQNTTLASLKQTMAKFVADRDWQRYHQPKNLAMSISIEAAELMEHFQWFDDQQIKEQLSDPTQKAKIADELADVLNYCLSFANAAEIDITQAVLNKITRNESRFPIGGDHEGK